MGLLSSISRKQSPETRKRTPPPQDPALVSALRIRARRRLIGSAVLVAGAVVALPAVFDTKPRPAVNNLAIRVTPAEGSSNAVMIRAGEAGAPVTGRTETAPAAALPPRGSAAGASRAAGAQSLMQTRPGRDEDILTEEKPDASAASSSASAAAAQQKRDRERAKADKARAEKAREAAREKAEKAEKAEKSEKATEAAKARAARAALAGEDEEDKPRRYVVQVGSFAEARTVRDMRQRVSDLGLRSHEQKVETASGEERTRVRLGPFKTKEEAQQAAARLKAAGMKAAVLPR